ncbi:hypothetical protein PVAP13_8KG085500 [Panicum virgatum]|uniref:Uncharacterized protein n=1 Tax=Panicum virgatum TaxID=38727 RepID=A0A8T0PER2_PANVG|nr:hypothetical protein PVAP13_8KG085500 [Panicum virgatum]
MRRSCTCGAGGEVPADELDAPLLVLDLERGRGQDHTVAPTMTAVPAAAMTEAVRAALLLDAQEVEVGKAAWKAIKCIFRGLIALLWVYLIDLVRRYVATHSVEELAFTICPLGLLALAVSMFFCVLLGCLEKCLPPISPSPKMQSKCCVVLM